MATQFPTPVANPPPTPTTPATPAGAFPGTGGPLSAQPPVLPPGSLMLNRWRVVGKLGQGAFGQTLEADDTVLNKRVAIKFETGTAAKQVLKLEISILKRLQGCPYSAQFFASGTIEIGHPPAPQTYMVMSLLGTNLSDLRKQQLGNKFSIATTALLGKQMIEALKWVHQSGYLHRDVKPSNFVMGLEKYPDERGVPRARCYIIDFGLSRRYMTPEGTVREARSTAGFRGTARYASLNAHESKELARRDDFWSIFYLLTEFLVGHLPWRKEKDRDAVYRIKRACTSPALIDGLPGAMLEMYYHLRSLAYTAVPDYALMQRLMDDMFDEARVPAAVAYDWEAKAAPTSVVHTHHQQARVPVHTPTVILSAPPKPPPKPKAATTNGTGPGVLANKVAPNPRARSPHPIADPALRVRRYALSEELIEDEDLDDDEEDEAEGDAADDERDDEDEAANEEVVVVDDDDDNLPLGSRIHGRRSPPPVMAADRRGGGGGGAESPSVDPLVPYMSRMRIGNNNSNNNGHDNGRVSSPAVRPPTPPIPTGLVHQAPGTPVHQQQFGYRAATPAAAATAPRQSVATTIDGGYQSPYPQSQQAQFPPYYSASSPYQAPPSPLHQQQPHSPYQLHPSHHTHHHNHHPTHPPHHPPPGSSSQKVGMLQRIQRGVRGLQERLLSKSPNKSHGSAHRSSPAPGHLDPHASYATLAPHAPVATLSIQGRSAVAGPRDGGLETMHRAHDSKYGYLVESGTGPGAGGGVMAGAAQPTWETAADQQPQFYGSAMRTAGNGTYSPGGFGGAGAGGGGGSSQSSGSPGVHTPPAISPPKLRGSRFRKFRRPGPAFLGGAKGQSSTHEGAGGMTAAAADSAVVSGADASSHQQHQRSKSGRLFFLSPEFWDSNQHNNPSAASSSPSKHLDNSSTPPHAATRGFTVIPAGSSPS